MYKFGKLFKKKFNQKSGNESKTGYSKGYVYTIEVMLSVVTVIFVLVLLFSKTPEQPETSMSIIKQNGYNALSYMDQSGDLRKIVIGNDTDALKRNVTSRIPTTTIFDAAICSGECSSANLPANRTIVSVDYFVSGYQEVYLGKKVRLWMWQKF